MSVTANATVRGSTDPENLLSPEEAATRLRCSAHTLARWRSEGHGPRWLKLGPKRIAYSISDLEAYVARAS